MQLQINIEVPDIPRYAHPEQFVSGALMALYCTAKVETRLHSTSYTGPDGAVVTKVVVAKVEVPCIETDGLYELAERFEQDCLALLCIEGQHEFGTLIGPRAHKWGPFNPDYFVRF